MKDNSSSQGLDFEINQPAPDFSRLSIAFKNLEKSELAEEIVRERVADLYKRFPLLKSHDLRICLSMENSFSQAGPDLFTAKMIVRGRRFRNLVLEKSAPNLYQALAKLDGHSLERLNRAGDRRRVKNRTQKRRLIEGANHETK